MTGARIDEVHASDLRGLVADERALRALVAESDPVVHRDSAAETYVCTEGLGGLLLSDGKRAEWIELRPGDVASIPAGQAHRTVNVGREPFSFLAVYEPGAGNDYATVARRGMGARVVRSGESYRVLSTVRTGQAGG